MFCDNDGKCITIVINNQFMTQLIIGLDIDKLFIFDSCLQ